MGLFRTWLGGEATVYRGHEGVRDFHRDTAGAFTDPHSELPGP